MVGTKWEGLKCEPNSDINLDCYMDSYFSVILKDEDDQDPVCVKSRYG